MKACEGRIGRVFVIRLEDGDVVPERIEHFAEENGALVGKPISVGGIRISMLPSVGRGRPRLDACGMASPPGL